jgi:hypothetical protein
LPDTLLDRVPRDLGDALEGALGKGFQFTLAIDALAAGGTPACR